MIIATEFVRGSSARQAFFESFSRIAMQMVKEKTANTPGLARRPPPLIMLTGGLSTRAQCLRALTLHHANLLGLARAATLHPTLPHDLYECFKGQSGHAGCNWSWEALPDPEPKSPAWWPRIVGAGVGLAWYDLVMRRLSEGHPASCRTASAAAYSYPYPPSSHWLLIIFDMYVEPIAEYIVSKTLFISRTSAAHYNGNIVIAALILSGYDLILNSLLEYGWIGTRHSLLLMLALACICGSGLVMIRKTRRLDRALDSRDR